MALVNYSSESGEDPDGGPPPAKRRRCAVQAAETSGNPTGTDGPCSKLPPLPAAFHDLYASSVRQSVVDDPSLHHGRKRQTPHVVGNWPTHLYTECESTGHCRGLPRRRGAKPVACFPWVLLPSVSVLIKRSASQGTPPPPNTGS